MHQGPRYRLHRRSAWLAGLTALAMAGAAAAQTTFPVALDAAGLESALLTLANQTHQQIMFSKAVVAGRRAPVVSGRMTPEQALERLLAGTDLRARRASPTVVVVERAGAAGAPANRPFVDEGEAAATADLGDGATAPAEAAAVAPAVLEEVVVTGSNIRGAAPASPLVVMTQSDLERSGQTNVADALRALPANFAGGAGESTFGSGGDRVGRNGTYASALNLRGLGNNATLVLFNGRRMAGSGPFGDFVDISTVPVAAIARVEVLLDGASALYGSDAVGGVVNIITRRDYEGAETRILGGVGTAGEPTEFQASQTIGRRWAGGGVVASYELRRRENLPGSERRNFGDADLRPLGGTDQRPIQGFPGNILVTDPVTRALVPGFAIPGGQDGTGLRPGDFLPGVINRQNNRQGMDALPKQTVNSLYLAADQALGDALTVSGDVRYSSRRYRTRLAPISSTLTVSRANPYFVSPTGAASHSIAYSFANVMDNPISFGTAEVLSTSLGGELRLPHGWRAEGYGAFAQEIGETRGTTVLNSLVLNEALGNVPDNPGTPYSPALHGYFNPFAGVPTAANRQVAAYIGSGRVLARGRARVSSANLQFDGPLWALPGGPIKLAVGAQARREETRRTSIALVSTATPQTTSDVDLGRDVLAAFAEAQIPLFGPQNARPGLERLEVSIAARVEDYEAIGRTANPKAGVIWTPVDGVTLRGTFGRSFRAPNLRETSDPEAYFPQNLAYGTGRLQILQLSGGNPDLKPETATSWTLGFDLRPASLPGLSVSVTGFDVRFKDRIGQPVAANLPNVLRDPTLSMFVTYISPTTSAADLALIESLLASPALSNLNGTFPPEAYGAIVENRYVNTSKLQVRGVDGSIHYRFALGRDTVGLGADATYMLRYRQQITPTSSEFDRVGVINFPVRFRGRLTADWTRDRLTLGGAINYTDAYRDAVGVRIDDLTTLDLQARWRAPDRGALSGVTVLLNVRNAFDRDPPFYNNSIGIAYDGATGDPIGRFVSLQLTRSW